MHAEPDPSDGARGGARAPGRRVHREGRRHPGRAGGARRGRRPPPGRPAGAAPAPAPAPARGRRRRGGAARAEPEAAPPRGAPRTDPRTGVAAAPRACRAGGGGRAADRRAAPRGPGDRGCRAVGGLRGHAGRRRAQPALGSGRHDARRRAPLRARARAPRGDPARDRRLTPLARSPVQDYLERLHEEYADMRDGAVADYIPPLADADPDAFGICLATTDGHLYEVGDTRVPFTIQSMSKPFTYGLALADRGRALVAEKVGVEPSGDAFNSISLAPGSGQPRNPMINAGAIVSASLVSGATPDERFARVLATYSHYAGRPLAVDEAVYASEHDTGHRNRAIGHMLRSFGILDADVEGVLDRYFRQCSVLVEHVRRRRRVGGGHREAGEERRRRRRARGAPR